MHRQGLCLQMQTASALCNMCFIFRLPRGRNIFSSMALRTEGPCVFESSCCCYHHVRISGQEDPAVQAPVPCSKDRSRWATSVRTEVCLRGRGVRALGGRFQGREGCKV